MAFTLPIPPDTVIITDDSCIAGTSLIDPATGTIIGFTTPSQFAGCSESGIVMLDGTIATPDNTIVGFGNGQVSIYDINLELVAAITLGTPPDAGVTGFATDRINYFYVIVAGVANALTLYKIDKLGNTLQTWNLATADSSDPIPCAVTRDNNFFFWDDDSDIKKLDLNTSAITIVASKTFVTWMGIDTSNNIYLNRNVATVAKIEKYDINFNLLGSVNAGPNSDYGVDFAHFSADDQHLFAWTIAQNVTPPPSQFSVFRKIRLSDLAVISDTPLPGVPTENNSNDITPGQEMSNSCPLLISGSITGFHSNECVGGALPGQDNGNPGNAGCLSCTDPTVPLDPSIPAFFVTLLNNAGANGCFDLGIVEAVSGPMHAFNFTEQRNSAGMVRGRFYQGFPTPNFDKYVDTNRGCLWAWVPHGI